MSNQIATEPLPVMRLSEPTDPPDFMVQTTNQIPVQRADRKPPSATQIEQMLATKPVTQRSFKLPFAIFLAAFAAMGIAIALLMAKQGG